MPSNFLRFDPSATNIMSDADYLSSTQRQNGVVPGLAQSALHNKLFYQTSGMTAAIAEVLSNKGATVSDSDYAGLVTAITTHLANTIWPAGTLYGLTLSNNTTDAANDIDITAGSAVDSTGVENMVLAAGLTKRTDAAWAVGNNQGGMDTGSKPLNGTLHVFQIKRTDTGVVDILFSQSATTPTMPSGYTRFRRIGSVVTDGSGNLRGFYQIGDWFLWKNRISDVDVTTLGTSATLYTLTVPTGIRVGAMLAVQTIKAASGVTVLISSPDTNDEAPSNTSTLFTNTNEASGQNGTANTTPIVWTNTSAQIRARSNVASTILKVVNHGWIDTRGRLA